MSSFKKEFDTIVNKLPNDKKEELLNYLNTDKTFENIFEEKFDFLTKLYNKIKHDKKQLEFVINFGPQASGKGMIKRKIFPFYDNINVDEITQLLKDKFTVDEYWNSLRPVADKESNRRLIKSIMAKNNIVWETMGANLKWLIYYILFMKKHEYKIILAFPIVKLQTLIDRCKKRDQTASCEKIPSLREQIYKNFTYLLPFLDEVLIFDNNTDLKYIYRDNCLSIDKQHFDKIFEKSDINIIDYINQKAICSNSLDINGIPFKQLNELNSMGKRRSRAKRAKRAKRTSKRAKRSKKI